mgnify:CR=1 FL=1
MDFAATLATPRRLSASSVDAVVCGRSQGEGSCCCGGGSDCYDGKHHSAVHFELMVVVKVLLLVLIQDTVDAQRTCALWLPG